MFSPLEYRLLFNFLPGMGAASYWRFVEHFGSIDCVFEKHFDALKSGLNPAAETLLNEFGQYGNKSQLYRRVAEEIEAAEKVGVHFITDADVSYPSLLKETKRCPNVLYVKGNVNALALPQIAIVGSRSPSPTGQELAFEFAKGLSETGFSITSGLALGVDGCAHRGALEANTEYPVSATIAVLGSGLNCIYPRRNVGLANDIVAKGGAIVSEFPMHTSAKPQHFPQRNRIVSGLAYGTLVIEAALKSGSLITARYALQQNREVFAIPGSIRSAVSAGCHAMIKSGAKLVEKPADIVCELKNFVEYQRALLEEERNKTDFGSPENEIDSEEQVALDAVGYETTDIEQVAERTALPVERILPLLLKLELQGKIENLGIGYIRI